MLKTMYECWLEDSSGDFDKLGMQAYADSEFISLKSGADIRLYKPNEPIRSWVLSLHGGPESYENQEIRYGGIYLSLLNSGIAVVVLNYRGSKKGADILGARVGSEESWKKSIAIDYQETLNSLPAVFGQLPVTFLGPSFGGTLALLLAQSFRCQKLVLFSPLLDLQNQIRRGGKEYKDWFSRTFCKDDEKDIKTQSLSSGLKYPTMFTYGSRDEVLGRHHFSLFSKYLEADSRNRVMKQNCGHVPSGYREYEARYQLALRFITNDDQSFDVN